ncbi:reverse transcriptase-like protein [Glacieibacterium sp.]|uniref:reverse transcriptase-like protein n=1 Tax=Glacieibacterium sp. TaxID=2860237 RepID=UPI003B00D099
MKIFFDGGCRPNPGRIEVAVVAGGVTYLELDLGHGTSNDAEWLAALHALEVAASLGVQDVQLLGDSAFVVDQANRSGSGRASAFAARFDALRSQFTRVRIRRIGRAQNLAGIALSRRYSGR